MRPFWNTLVNLTTSPPKDLVHPIVTVTRTVVQHYLCWEEGRKVGREGERKGGGKEEGVWEGELRAGS